MLFKFNQPFLPFENGFFCTPFCGLRAGCEAKIFCGSKNFCVGRLWRTSVRRLVHLEKIKNVGCSRRFFIDQMDKSIWSLRRPGDRTRSHGVNFCRAKRGRTLWPSAGAFSVLNPKGQYEENVTFEKVTKLLGLVSARN